MGQNFPTKKRGVMLNLIKQISYSDDRGKLNYFTFTCWINSFVRHCLVRTVKTVQCVCIESFLMNIVISHYELDHPKVFFIL